LNTLQAMTIFKRIAELESFTKAAESLGLPKGSVSTSIQQLETALGTTLLYRTTRRVQLTHDGSLYYQRCRDLLADMEELDTMFQKGKVKLSGRLRVDLPTRLARDIVVPKLDDFLRKHPSLEIELSCTDRKVDVIREGFDCVLRVGSLSESGLIARHVMDLPIVNCVSPAYIKRYGTPKDISDLERHRLIHYVPTLGAKSMGFEYFQDGELKFLAMKGALTVNNTDAYYAGCLGGFGIAQMPRVGAQNDLEAGRLIEVLPDCIAEPMPMTILFPQRRNVARRVQVFIDWLDQLLRERGN
jgi:DNA-binding transcriptional LysR family regulator